MAKHKGIVVNGVVEEALSQGRFRVKLENDHMVMCQVSGKIRMNKIMVTEKDRVQVELSPYDLSMGRILYRYPN